MNSCQDGASLLKAGPMSNSSHVSPPALGKAGLPSGFDGVADSRSHSSGFGGVTDSTPHSSGFGGVVDSTPDSSGFGGVMDSTPDSSGFGGVMDSTPHPSGFGNEAHSMTRARGFSGPAQAKFGGLDGADRAPGLPAPDLSGQAGFGPGGADGRFDEPLIEGEGDMSEAQMVSLMTAAWSRGHPDIVLTSGDTPWVKIGAFWTLGSKRVCRLGEISSLLNSLTGDSQAAVMVRGGERWDFRCEFSMGRSLSASFRINASNVANGTTSGISLSIRSLRITPPTLASLQLEPELIKALFPESGLVLVTGIMGSGKSTLLAGALGDVCVRERRHVATYESPIEFDFMRLKNRQGPVEQTEVHSHLGGFSKAVRSITRRAADVVLIGELGDPETIRSALEAAEIGVATYATLHSRCVAATPGRLLNVFEPNERTQAAASLFSTIRLIIHQRLVPGLNGQRVAIREWAALDEGMREALMAAPMESLHGVLSEMVHKTGRSLESSARRGVVQGLIDESVLDQILLEKRHGC